MRIGTQKDHARTFGGPHWLLRAYPACCTLVGVKVNNTLVVTERLPFGCFKCRDIVLRRTPDPGGPPFLLSYIRSRYLVTVPYI
jgi:hypothetical protein